VFFWTSRASTPEWTRLISGRLITICAPFGWVSTASPSFPEGPKIGISEGSGSPRASSCTHLRAHVSPSCRVRFPVDSERSTAI